MDSPSIGWRDREDVAPAAPSANAISRLVRRAFALRRYRPRPLPHAAMRLLNSTRAETVDFVEVAQIVESDVTLAAEVIRIVNGPVYSRGIDVTSVLQGVNRIGFDGLREIAAQAAMKVTTPPSPMYEEVFRSLHLHAAATAQLTRLVARAAGLEENRGFLPGLFHDVGYLAALLLLVDVYGDLAPPVAAAWSEVERIHPRVGRLMCELWQLPNNVVQAARDHHRVPVHVEHALVVVADQMAVDSGAPMPFPEHQHHPRFVAQALELLGLDRAQYDALATRAPTVVEGVAAAY